MNMIAELVHKIVFLGVSDYFEAAAQPFPFGPIDIFRLSRHKVHIVYPAAITTNFWIFLIESTLLQSIATMDFRIRVSDELEVEIGTVTFQSLPNAEPQLESPLTQPVTEFAVLQNSETQVMAFQIDAVINRPCKCRVDVVANGNTLNLGYVEFHYSKAPPLTSDKLRAIESNPRAIKTIRMDLGCKLCPSKLNVYTGLNRSKQLDSEGVIWQSEMPDSFICECGRTNMSLEILKESMHGLLLLELDARHSNLHYVRRYGHEQVKRVANNYLALLESDPGEEPVQKYIEQNPILLSRFRARRLFFKPEIPGRFAAVFALVDTLNQLWLIELERAELNLFRKDSHPTHGLMHAYGQVTDWIHQYQKHPGAVLESLGLLSDDVAAVKGAVIAGRKSDVKPSVLQRHLSNPPYQNIEFLTCDELAISLIEISQNLA